MKKIIFLSMILTVLIGNIGFAAQENEVTVENQELMGKTRARIIPSDNEKKEKPKSRFFNFGKKSEWKLVWDDEFNGNQLDRTKWNYWENGNPWNSGNYLDENGNLVNQYGFNAKHYYLRDNVKVEGGNLVITLKKEDNKTVNISGVERKILYSSGAVHTRGLFNAKYGKIEMRAAMPKGPGTWPAFWLWPEGYSQADNKPAIGEIDIVEAYGDSPKRVTGTLHALKEDNTYESFPGSDFKIGKYSKTKLTDFNTYAVEWDEKEIKWLFNDKVYKRILLKNLEKKVQNPFNQPYFIMINVALKEKTGEDGDVDFPTEMKVDYVRVYQKDKN